VKAFIELAKFYCIGNNAVTSWRWAFWYLMKSCIEGSCIDWLIAFMLGAKNPLFACINWWASPRNGLFLKGTDSFPWFKGNFLEFPHLGCCLFWSGTGLTFIFVSFVYLRARGITYSFPWIFFSPEEVKQMFWSLQHLVC